MSFSGWKAQRRGLIELHCLRMVVSRTYGYPMRKKYIGKVGENSMNKAELVNEIAAHTGQSKLHVMNTVSALLHSLTYALAKGERVTLVGFGTFERRHRQARTG